MLLGSRFQQSLCQVPEFIWALVLTSGVWGPLADCEARTLKPCSLKVPGPVWKIRSDTVLPTGKEYCSPSSINQPPHAVYTPTDSYLEDFVGTFQECSRMPPPVPSFVFPVPQTSLEGQLITSNIIKRINFIQFQA